MTIENQDIIAKLLDLSFSLGKKLLCDIDGFHPYLFYFKNEDFVVITFEYLNDKKTLENEIIYVINTKEIETYVIVKDVTCGDTLALEFSVTVDNVGYEIMYIAYLKRNDDFIFSELVSLNEISDIIF